MKNSIVLLFAGLFLLAASQPCLAAATGVSIKMKPAKMSTHLSGDNYANNQPTIRVLSTGGKKYDALDTNKEMKFSVITKEAHTINWQVVDQDVKFTGQGDSVNFDPPDKNGNYKTKYVPPKFSMSPIELCNNEVKIRGKNSMLDGFVKKIPDAYTVKFKAKFKRTVLQSTHSKSDSVNVPAWVICEKTKKAKKDEPKQMVFLKSVDLKTSTKSYNGTCPATIIHMATFKVNRRGDIKYALLGEDGSKGPSGKLKFAKAGSKTVSWKRTIDIPKPKPGTLAGGEVGAPVNKYNGTTTLKYVLYGGKSKVGASPPPKKASFTVQCEKPKKTPARTQKTAPAIQQMQLKAKEVEKIQ